MKPVFTTIIVLLSSISLVLGQGWIKRKNAPNALSFATSSAINGKAYLTGGNGTATYAYDTTTKSWTQVATMPGDMRESPISGVANGKMYCGLGIAYPWSSSQTAVQHRLFFEYNPATDVWTSKATFPGAGKWLWAPLSLNNKIYITLGKTIIGGPGFCKDTWEYDPAGNVWILKDSFPGGFRDASTSFSLNGMGYVLGGIGSSAGINTMWQYNPNTNTWAQKATCPTVDNGGVAFTIGSYAYYLTSNLFVDSPVFYRYNPVNDTWTRLRDFPGIDRNVAASFSIGNSGYITTGIHQPDPMKSGSIYDLSETWEYTFDCPADVMNDLSIKNYKQLYCGDSIVIDTIHAYTVQNSGTAYTWFKSTDGVSYSILSGANTPELTNTGLTQTTYYKRLVSAGPRCFDTSLAIKIEVEHYKYPKIDTLTKTHLCFGDTVVLRCSNPYSKLWYFNGTYNGNTDSIQKTWTTGRYAVEVSNIGCSFTSDTIDVVVYPQKLVPFLRFNSASDTLICDTIAAAYQWCYDNGTYVTGETNSRFGPTVSGFYYVIITDSNGCSIRSDRLYYQSKAGIAGFYTNDIHVFPNPVTDILHVDGLHGRTDYVIITADGREVLKGTLHANWASVNTSKLSAGYYMLIFSNDNRESCRYQLLKQ